MPDHNIYIEHFALDEEGQPPLHFNQEEYLKGIEWKRKTHRDHGTYLIETYSYLKREGKLQSYLSEKLQERKIEFTLKSDEDMLASLKKFGRVSRFVELLANILERFKESDMALANLMSEVRDIRMRKLIEIFKPIYDSYEKHLQERGEIDYADMIKKAVEYVEEGKFIPPYTHILVDEFQDISRVRAELILALRKQKHNSVLFSVGDDWQSIYRFTGSDIEFIRKFEDKFGATAVTLLDVTFRFNNKIGDVSTKFILKNPDQRNKSIKSTSYKEEPAVSLVQAQEPKDGLMLSLDAINKHTQSQNSQSKTTIMILDRYHTHHTIKNTIKKKFPNLNISFSTIHAAKGKEADYVIVIGLDSGKNGFPCEKEEDPVLELFLPEKEKFPYAEERRLFYVALTRARHRVYLIYDPYKASRYIKELLENEYSVCLDEFSKNQEIPIVNCPECKNGSLVQRRGGNRPFIGCSHYPYCRHIEPSCLQCGNVMRADGELRKICTNKKCRQTAPVCPECGTGILIQRNGVNGPFWGCSNYHGNEEFSCKYTQSIKGQHGDISKSQEAAGL